MTADWQTITALLIVLFAAGLLLRSFLAKRKKPGCGGNCGCPTDDFKARLKRSGQ